MDKILVSACLVGEQVRYDASAKTCENPVFIKWKAEGRLVPVCPELLGGMPCPRPPAELRGDRVIAKTETDVTTEYTLGALKAVRIAREYRVVCCILKEDSPSCGSSTVYDGSFSGRKIPGVGLAARALHEADFAVFNEHEIEKARAHVKD
jgi:uncharacterized protein YbbK (DUF523 family)